ncbi:MBL fold metallo-hydrolase [bacterium]|nr:MBL fold metallo-hydrolase [bacterium]
MRITFLGTGTSHGIPVIGCHCPVCKSSDPRDRRSRTSVIWESKQASLLVDAVPELRLQLISAGIDNVDALLLTHAHSDHVAGLDDVRIFSERSGQKFPVYGAFQALRAVRRRYDYIFRNTQKGGGKPQLSLHPVVGQFAIKGVKIIPVPLWHGRVRVFGYRLGNFAYLTDVSKIPDESYNLLKGLSVLVLDALRPEPHATHFHLERSLAEAKRVNAKRTYFIHMCHLLGHRETERRLPRTVRLAYDGLKLSL